MFFLSPYRATWRNGLTQGLGAVVALLVLLSVARLFFVAYFSSLSQYDLSDLFAVFWMGIRVDIKWLSIVMIPAWIFWILGYPWKGMRTLAKIYGALAGLMVMTLAVVNLAFYAFYRTPISNIIFGVFQDDTKAILTTVWQDWPVVWLTGGVVVASLLPLAVARLLKHPTPYGREYSRGVAVLIMILGTLAVAMGARGSLGKFPLRLQDWAVTSNSFLNFAVPNGMAALYEAYRSQQTLELKGGPEEGVRQLGFRTVNDAKAILNTVKVSAPQALAQAPQFVIFALMESMGRDEFELDGPRSDSLGALREAKKSAAVFLHGVAVGTGTFQSLEGLLFDSPIVPITQSRYGNKTFNVSRLLAYKKAGYETILLTSGSPTWRQMDPNFLRQGFDQVIGDKNILAKYPDAQEGTWGVGDAWMFRYARALLRDKAKEGKKVFLFMLSTTNHPTHIVPDGVKVNPVDPSGLPPFVVDDRTMKIMHDRLQTYQYSANALGEFVLQLGEDGLRDRTVMVATGDHNGRLHYEPTGYWHHANGVPILFWLPSTVDLTKWRVNTERWVSHRDIFPTLGALALNQTERPEDGRNLFAPEDERPAQSYQSIGAYGMALGPAGAVGLEGNRVLRCYAWKEDVLTPLDTCTPALQRMGDIARAQYALQDYAIRSDLLSTH